MTSLPVRQYMTRFITRMEQFVKLTSVNPDITISNNVALVGSSAILLEKEYGSLIDSYDTVIRFNRAPTIGFETHVGSKTTIRMANPHVFSNIPMTDDKRFPNPKVTQPKNFIREQKNISVIHANNDTSGWNERTQHVHPTSKAFLMEPISFKYLPTVGLRGISLMVKNNIGFKNFYVNSWAYFLIKKLKIKKINNSQIHIKVGRQGLLSNLLHFIHFFSYLDNYSKIIDKKKSKKIIKFSRDKTYNEVTGKIKIETLNKNKLLVETFTSKKYAFCIKIKNNNKIIYEINFEKNGLIHLKTRTRKETITFPFSSNTTFLFLKALLTGKNQFMPSARIDFKISTFILSFLKVKIY